MHRRKFIHTGSLAGLSLFGISALGFNIKSENGLSKLENGFKLDELSIDDLQKMMKSGGTSSQQIVKLYLDRISEIDKKGPLINSIIELNPDALKIAAELDKERAAGKIRGPLHGIPILIKDNIDTADKMQTTAGSIAMEGNIAKTDSFVVKQLRKAGVVILGKTNMSEWANFRSTRSSSGWSSRGGQTRNPYVLDRSPCGSSSGSGVSVAANLCAVSVGTETNGSIACPASMNNVVGIKPTVGLVSRTGIIPISKTQDTAGPMGRTVKDATLLLGAMTGVDTDDAATSASQGKSLSDYTAFLKADGLTGKRIGIEKGFLKKHEGIDILFKDAIEVLKSKGATIVEVEFIKFRSLGSATGEVLEYEFKDGLNAYLSKANGKVKSLEELIRFNNDNAARAMPIFQQELLESSQKRGDLKSPGYLEAYAKVTGVRKMIDDLLTEQNLDALCGPATGPSWCIDPVNGDFGTGYGSYGPAALAGYPSVTVPMGFVSEIPVGLSFLGRAYDEGKLITIAYAYEQFSKKRRAPKFIKSI
ncbi:amidase [Dyadobacter sp. CY345]|uniref:amidase n=1 Tax=Dyadobacter sp. CY345 TaxID=2909335 RepID=UPI001F47306D|nr:amidase [Dyadobacter sp. CY345]MCF2445524.1 amidase [Dyadobacter sp. CY345]